MFYTNKKVKQRNIYNQRKDISAKKSNHSSYECVGCCGETYIDVIDVEDFGLEEQPESSGLLDGVSQLTVRLTTGTGR